MITMKNIVKRFDNNTIINNISLKIQQGQIFGLLGPNGAGKTTLIRMLCGIIKADNGTITINNHSVEKSKNIFGYVSQYFAQYEELTVWENLHFYATMYGHTDTKKLEALLQRYNLYQYRDTLSGKLSGGYKRRLALVCALSHDPLVLFLDEPTAGIDPVTRKQLWDDFYQLSKEGKTLFVTTHYMEEAQRCDTLAFLAQGEIVAKGSPENIKSKLGNVKLYTIKTVYNPKITNALANVDGIILLNQLGNELRITMDENTDIQTIENIFKNELNITSNLHIGSLNLEDVFISLTQGKAL